MKRIYFNQWFDRLTSHYMDDRFHRHSLFLSGFLLLTLAEISLLAIGNLAVWLINSTSKDLGYFYQDLLVIPIFLVLLSLNWRGYVTQVSFVYILFIVIGISLTFPKNETQFTLLLYVLPIIAAGFTIRPAAAFLVAGLCFGLYSAGEISNLKLIDLSLQLLIIGGLFSIALVTWFASDRFERVLGDALESKSKYLSLLENNPSCVYIVTGSQAGGWEYASPLIYDLLGFNASDWLGDSQRWIKQVHPDDRQRVLEVMAHTLSFGLPMHAEYRMIHHSGKIVWVSDDAIPTRTPCLPERVQGVLLDITAYKRTEQVQVALFRISQAAFQAKELNDLYADIHSILGELMHAENFFIALYDPDTNMLNFPYFVDEYDQRPEPIRARHGLTEFVLRTGKPLFASPEKFAELTQRGEVANAGTPSVDWLGVPLIVNNLTMGVMAVQSYTEGVRFSAEELEIMRFVSTQVAMVIDRKQTEAELHELSQLNSEVISGVNTGIIVYDKELNHLIWNRYMEQMTGLSESSLLGRGFDDAFPLFRRASLPGLMEQVLNGESVALPDIRYTVDETGKSGWLDGYCGPYRNAQGQIVGVISVINEITERKKDEEALRAALKEKEVLLREIHHRVKNNLQVMSSLLSLQTDAVQDEGARSILQEMQLRVRSMALIHEVLYQSKDLSRVNFAEYIERLAAGLRQTYMLKSNSQLNLDLEEIYLGVDTAIPCGLVISELVTNAFKYAYPTGQNGDIWIRLHRTKTGANLLSVSDHGVGLPAGLDINDTETLGLQLVTILSRQLRAKLNVEQTGGTSFQIKFREQKGTAPLGNIS